MSSFPNFTEKWDKEVKPLAQKVAKECKKDPLVAQYISAMIWGVEHDLADGRRPHFRLYPCAGTLNAESYYGEMHRSTGKEEVKKLRGLGKLLKELEGLDSGRQPQAT